MTDPIPSEAMRERAARSSFLIIPRETGRGTLSNFRPFYDVKCVALGCDKLTIGPFDYRANALRAGFIHASRRHRLDTLRAGVERPRG